MTYTIFAIITFIVALSLILSVDYRSSFTGAKYKGKMIFRKSKPIYCKVNEISWSRNAETFFVCDIGDNRTIEILSKNKLGKKPDNMWLIQSKIKGGTLYSFMPVTVPENNNLIFKEGEREFTVSNCEKINRIIKGLYLTLCIFLAISFLIINIFPLLSIFFSTITIFLASKNIPFKNWTKSKECSIIKNKETKLCSDNNEVNSVFPSGYKDWSLTEKELFNIETKIGARAMPGDEFSRIEPSEYPDLKSNWIASDKLNTDDFSIEEENSDSPRENIIPKACHSCGCIVDENSLFCPHCGEKLSYSQQTADAPLVSDQAIASDIEIGSSQNEPTPENVSSQNNINNKQGTTQKKNRRHRSRNANTNNTNSELVNVLAAAEASLF